jgi:hypothetical protein
VASTSFDSYVVDGISIVCGVAVVRVILTVVRMEIPC